MKNPSFEPAPTVARINVTPIIDVALVLVIILLITAPMIATADMDINLPAAKTRNTEDEVRLRITLGKKGEVAINDEFIAQRDLVSVLETYLADANDKNVLVVVRADATVTYDRVRAVLKDAHKAGARRIAIATRQRGKLN